MSKMTINWVPSRSFFLGSIGVTTLVTTGLVYGSVAVKTQDSAVILALIFVTLSMALNLTTLFYTGFTHAVKRGAVPILKDPRSMLASIGATQGIAATLGIMGRLSAAELALVTTLLQIWGTYLFFQLSLEAYMITKRDLKFLPHATAGAVGLVAVICVTLRHWFSPTTSLNVNLFWQSSVTAVGLFGTLAYISWSRGLRLSATSLRQSLLLRLSGKTSGGSRKGLYLSFVLSWCVSAALWLSCNIISTALHSDAPIWLITGISTFFIPALYLSWSELREQSSQQAELVVSSRLAGDTALLFLRRNLKQDRAWAAAVGVRTTVFTIDHDPENQIALSLPATLNQIRSEEISRCVNEVLNKRLMHHRSYSQRIFGALDPEHSPRPCIDLLKLFACLYLDAGPLIERRINGLTALLPIVNPGLARVMKPEQLATIMKRNQWFFHFDYHWVDQHMINTPGSTRYGVHLDPLSADVRQAMFEYLRKANGMGNFLWLGKEAQERLLQEAPMLAPIIEPLTLKAANEQEFLIFVMRFENLIPRLQRYFDLDQTRVVLMDFEPSHESAKLINIFKLQAANAQTAAAMIHLVDSLASYPWRGFKEKDQALKIIVLAHQYASQVVATCEKEGTTLPADALKLQQCIQISVEKIGYPAQILHHAQLQKIALRDIQTLVESAKNAFESRFDESWVLLSSLDFRRYSVQERALVLSLLDDQESMQRVLNRSEVQSKYIYASVNLAKAELNLGRNLIDTDKMFSKIIINLCAKNPTAETLTVLLDSMTFIAQLIGKDVALTTAAKNALEASIRPFESSRADYASALWGRWNELRQRQRTLPKAS